MVCGITSFNFMLQRLESVPADWAEKVTLPPRFSAGTTAAVESRILVRKHRDEIVNSVIHVMIAYTMKPSGHEYNTICRRLIGQYPMLKDKKSETGNVSSCLLVYGFVHVQFQDTLFTTINVREK